MERAEEKLRSANLLYENKMFADTISEAYYAMFHVAKSLLALKNICAENFLVRVKDAIGDILKEGQR
uniref:HEPN domain-containing protein n=1 Tax=Candidatus Methanophagaceae archaeon ANME-1 ERB6 TaxID=2759912 RepID=A0A7G9YSF2_9EURY|nr:hypothetical protein BBGANOMO_00010 [Methanosarcinales archaeon ANME-1 ERB6]